MLTINYFNSTKYSYSDLINDYQRIGNYLIKRMNLKGKIEISVNFVSKNRIQEINRDYRHLDRVTDIISFEDDSLLLENNNSRVLGDLFICVFRAKQQALKYGHSIHRELCFLFTHGFLHLLKYDHMNEHDEKIMFDIQNEVLEHFKIYR